MGRTNKHKRSLTTDVKSSSKNEEEETTPSGGSADVRNRTGGKSLLTMPQLVSLIMISIAFSYLMEMKDVLFDNQNCNTYLQPSSQKEGIEDGDKSCSLQDLAILRAKFHSGIICELLVGLCIILCWKNDLLMLRLHAFLCMAPLASTILAIQFTKTAIHPGFAGKLGMMVTTLLILVAGSLYNAPTMYPLKPIKGDLSNATFLTLLVGYGWEAYKFIIGGAAGFMKGTNEGETASSASFVLMPFLAVDQLALVILCIFGIAFLPSSPQRYLLFFIGLIHMIYHYYLIPQIRSDLVDADYYDNLYFGSAMFALTASIAPSMTFFEFNAPGINN